MAHYVDPSLTKKVTRTNVCKDCGGKLFSQYAGRQGDKIVCVECGEEFSGWISRQKMDQQKMESYFDRREVEKAYPELEQKGMRIKTLRKTKLAFPEIGQVRKGVKEEFTRADGSKYTRPVDLDYFRVVFVEGEEAAAEKFRAVYGEQPQEINIRFPFNDIDRLWSSSLSGFLAGGLVAQSDGEIYLYLRDGITNQDIVRNGKRLDNGEAMPYNPDEPATYYMDKNNTRQPVFCEPSGLLRVMVPELERAAFLTVVTNSWHDIEAIEAYLEGLWGLTNGNIQGLPVVLKRRPNMISTPGSDGKRVRREKWLLHLEVEPGYAGKRFQALERAIYAELDAGSEPVAALPSGEEEVIVVDGFDHAKYNQHDVLEGEIEEEEEVEDDTLTPGLVRNKRQFYDLCKKVGLDKGASDAILKECGGDTSVSYDQILKQYNELFKKDKADG